MARWDRNWQAAAQGHSGRHLRRRPQRGGPTQSGKAVLSGGKPAPLNRAAGRDPLTSRPGGGGIGHLAAHVGIAGPLVNAPIRDADVTQAETQRSIACPGGGIAELGIPGAATDDLTVADMSARDSIPDGRAGRHPFSPGPPGPTGTYTRPTDLPQTLYVKIVREWTTTLTGPFDWADWPLDRYVFGEAFHQPLEDRRNLDDAAWLCAMIACGLAHEFSELDVQPRPAEPNDGRQIVRDDGARGYRCTIVAGRGAGSHLDFWLLPAGVIEFEMFVAMRLMRARTNTQSK